MPGDDHGAEFDRHRPHLTGFAYRMLGSLSEAEDAVQDAYLRWRKAPAGEIRSPKAWLTTALTRICIDMSRSARARRETYVGNWLPEPVLTEPGESPSARLELVEDLSMAFLVVLERLGPAERAAYLLREVFDYDYRGSRPSWTAAPPRAVNW